MHVQNIGGKNMNWRRKSFILFIFLLSLLLAACGGNGNDTENNENNNTANNEEKVIIYGSGGGPSALDPASVNDGETAKVTEQVTGGLVGLDESVGLQPRLAHDCDISEDGLPYTFYLEEGVRSH